MENKRDEIGREQGLWIYPYENGQPMLQGVYVNGVRQGMWKSWHKNGGLAFEWNYFNGELIGLLKGWYSDGRVASRSFYVDDYVESERVCVYF